MQKINVKLLWIIVLIAFIVGCGLVFGVTFTRGVWTTVVIVLLAIDFIFMTIAIQIASSRTFKYKPKAIKYLTKSYVINKEAIDKNLKAAGYKLRNANYGQNYLKVDGEEAFKVVVIRSVENYFNQENNNTTNNSGNKELGKCKRFIGIEIFLDYDEETLTKLVDFNIMGEKIYYAGLFYDKEDNKLICPNYIEPDEVFKPLLDVINNDLKLEIIEE